MRLFILTLCAVSFAFSKPNIPVTNFKAKIHEVAGKSGAFARHENFPKGYFLIPFNLPYLAGLTLHHPKSSTLELSKEQIKKIVDIKKKTVPTVLKIAKKIKTLELEIAEEISLKYKSVKAKKLYAKVDEVSKLRTKLTKAHLKCIEEVKTVLTEKQYNKLLKYAVINK